MDCMHESFFDWRKCLIAIFSYIIKSVPKICLTDKKKPACLKTLSYLDSNGILSMINV